MTIGERIRQRRIELGMTQDELAKAIGYRSRSSVNKIELSRELPLQKVELVAKALQCSPTQLMGWDDAPKEYIETSSSWGLIRHTVEYFDEQLTRPEFELVDLFRHCDKWGRKAITDTAKRELKRYQSEQERRGNNGYRKKY